MPVTDIKRNLSGEQDTVPPVGFSKAIDSNAIGTTRAITPSASPTSPISIGDEVPIGTTRQIGSSINNNTPQTQEPSEGDSLGRLVLTFFCSRGVAFKYSELAMSKTAIIIPSVSIQLDCFIWVEVILKDCAITVT